MTDAKSTQRLLSLDLFRGVTMFLLVLEGTFFYDYVIEFAEPGTFLFSLIEQFHHHPWNGLRFWDLVQPYFMFIVGVAMVFSLNKRMKAGDSYSDVFKHIIIRCITLFFFGVVLHCGYSGRLVWELWNVLTQLSFTILIAFSIIRMKNSHQLFISVGLLLITELLYRFAGVPGFDKPFVQGENFGSWMDLVLMGKINERGWVAINALPTAAHTIWGVLTGKILLEENEPLHKIKIIASYGLAAIIIGYAMDWTGFSPIIKRICTSSFVIVSGGWSLLTLAATYWLVDVKGYKKGLSAFIVVGMNPIFIYMFSETLGMQWFNGFINIFTGGLFSYFSLDVHYINIINSVLVFLLELKLCFWLYNKKIFFKI